MTIAGQTFTVNQSGAATCTFSISPTQRELRRTAAAAERGGHGRRGLRLDGGASNVPWITITAGSSGSGNGTVTYSVAPFSGPLRIRTGTIDIAGKTFMVTQSR